MAIPDPIFKQMIIKFKAARVFHPSGCITLNDRMPCINYDKQRNQIRILVEKQGRQYKVTARRIAIYLKTGQLTGVNQAIYVTCSNFHCVNPEHLRIGESGERSSVRNDKRDCRTEELKRRLSKHGSARNGGSKQGYTTYTYSEEHHLSCDESEFPLWAQDLENTIDVKATRVD